MSVDEEFVRETDDALRELTVELVDLEGSADRATLDEAFRRTHALKGNLGMVGLDEVQDLAHVLEDVLEAVRAGERRADREAIDAMLDAADEIGEAVERAHRGEPVGDLDPLIDRLRSLADGETTGVDESDASPADGADGDDATGAGVGGFVFEPTGEAAEPDDDPGYEEEPEPNVDGESGPELDEEVQAALEEASEFDDLDALVEEVDDAAEFAALEGGGSFDDVVDDPGDEATEPADAGLDESTGGADDPSEGPPGEPTTGDGLDEPTEVFSDQPAADAPAEPAADDPGQPADDGAADDPADAGATAPGSATDEEVEEAVPSAPDGAYDEFQEIQQEVEPDDDLEQLQRDIAEADFGEFDDEDDVTIDELLMTELEAEPGDAATGDDGAADTDVDASPPIAEADAGGAEPAQEHGPADAAEPDRPASAEEPGASPETADTSGTSTGVESTIEDVEPAVERVEESAVEPAVREVPDVEESGVEPADEAVDLAAETPDVEPAVEQVEPAVHRVEPAVEEIEPAVEGVEPAGADPAESEPAPEPAEAGDEFDEEIEALLSEVEVSADEEPAETSFEATSTGLGSGGRVGGFGRDEATDAFTARFGDLFAEEETSEGSEGRVVPTIAGSDLDASAFGEADDDGHGLPARQRTSAPASLSVDPAVGDELLRQVRELAAANRRLAAAADETDPEVREALSALRSATDDVRRTALEVRLMPLSTVTDGLDRVVRDVAREAGVEVRFETHGTDVRLDRDVLDRIGDPLVHLVRNAVDHGIEPPDEREAADKPREGNVDLRARREGDTATIEIRDDGRGLDADAVREKAVDEDLVTEEAADSLSREETFELLFEPGFSTREEVTEASGRGVGMDAVERAVSDLNGTVEVESKPGEGTIVRLSVPVTVAVAEVVFLEVGDEQYAVPTADVESVQSATETFVGDETVRIHTAEGAQEYPLVRLGEALGAADAGSEQVVVRVDPAVRGVALGADAVGEKREVVITPYEEVLGGTPGIGGATLLEDNTVVNVIDVETV